MCKCLDLCLSWLTLRQGYKSSVHYDHLDKFKRFEITELPAHPAFYTRYLKEGF